MFFWLVQTPGCSKIMASVTCLCKNNFPSVPGEDLVSKPPGKGAQDQQEEAPAASLLHHHTHASNWQQWQCRGRRWSPWKWQCHHGDKQQQQQQRVGVPFIPAFKHQRGVLRMLYWTLVLGNWTKNSPQWTEKLLHHILPLQLKLKLVKKVSKCQWATSPATVLLSHQTFLQIIAKCDSARWNIGRYSQPAEGSSASLTGRLLQLIIVVQAL